MRISDWSSDVCSSDLDSRLGHREFGVSGRDAEFGRERDADATAHRDPVHERDHRLGIGEQRVVHAIFFEEETPRLDPVALRAFGDHRSEAHTSELQSIMRISYAVFCLKKKTKAYNSNYSHYNKQ